jgi:hypothetical protein
VQGLDHWYALGPSCVVSRRRDEGKSVMEVNYLGSLFAKELAQGAVGCAIPDGGTGQSQRSHVLHPVVVVGVAYYPAARSLQEIAFSGEDLVLTAGLLVVLVNYEDRFERFQFLLFARGYKLFGQ